MGFVKDIYSHQLVLFLVSEIQHGFPLMQMPVSLLILVPSTISSKWLTTH